MKRQIYGFIVYAQKKEIITFGENLLLHTRSSLIVNTSHSMQNEAPKTNDEKNTAIAPEVIEEANAAPALVQRQESIKKCFIEAWKLYTGDTIPSARRLKTVRAFAALLFALSLTFLMIWGSKAYIGWEAIGLMLPEELTWTDKFLMLQTNELWFALATFILALIVNFVYIKKENKALTAVFEPLAEKQPLSKGFGKRFTLCLVILVPYLVVLGILTLPVVFLALSYYQRENAILINDPINWSITNDLSTLLVLMAVCYILLSLSMFWKIANKMLKV